MRYPKKLKKGDTVGLICSSSAIGTDRVAECKKAVEDLGFQVKLADNLDQDYGGYMAGSGKTRGEWVNKMFADPEVNGIFCIRGGDGGSRAMEYIDFDLVKANPKVFVGYSDVTSLHLALNQQCDLVTFHGPMVSSNMVDSFDEETKASFFAALEAEDTFEFCNPKGCEIDVMKTGKASGRLIGGNLSLLSAAIGTPYEPDTKGKILFIEEVCEPVTKIEKWTYHLKNAGKLADCAGIILGQFTKIVNEECPAYDVYKCLEEIFEDLDIPVMYNVESGHGKPMMTLPMGALCTMDTEKKSIVFKVER
ncbi:MAG: LD-carboxypeptidase [Emergencia sp.]|uniref:S66 peptidase family protein n=1 Tax=Emergencia sp. JLR.KK010 TaxID=3114296 RepID=UPI002171081E|nr:LD-carboxypeptidase [Emergencia sp.]